MFKLELSRPSLHVLADHAQDRVEPVTNCLGPKAFLCLCDAALEFGNEKLRGGDRFVIGLLDSLKVLGDAPSNILLRVDEPTESLDLVPLRYQRL